MNLKHYKNTIVKMFLCQCGKAKHLCVQDPTEGWSDGELERFRKLRKLGYKSQDINLLQARRVQLCFSCTPLILKL